MKQNPYDSPATVEARPAARRSRGPYLVATLIVVVTLLGLAAFVGWYTEAYSKNGEIVFQIPGESLSDTPLGDPVIAYDRFLFVPVAGVATICAIVLAVTLGVVNGLIFCWRRC